MSIAVVDDTTYSAFLSATVAGYRRRGYSDVLAGKLARVAMRECFVSASAEQILADQKDDDDVGGRGDPEPNVFIGGASRDWTR